MYCGHPGCCSRFLSAKALNQHKLRRSHYATAYNLSSSVEKSTFRQISPAISYGRESIIATRQDQSSEPSAGERICSRPEVLKARPSFQCTFCHMQLTEKSWKRHEESQHLPQREWTCMPHAQPIKEPTSGNAECVFCGMPNLGTHQRHDCSRILECLARSYEDRTFSRKDKLVQHLRQYHGVEMDSSIIDAWATGEPIDQSWKCGFCGEMLPSWEIRAKHIAKHFREGYDMTLWKYIDDHRSL